MNKETLCAYCGKWFSTDTMTPLYEEGKSHVNHYCERCVDEVKGNLYGLHFRHLFTWGEKGKTD